MSVGWDGRKGTKRARDGQGRLEGRRSDFRRGKEEWREEERKDRGMEEGGSDRKGMTMFWKQLDRSDSG